MTDPVSAWHAEHAYFSRLLRLLHRELDAVHAGEDPNLDLLADIVGYLREYSDRVHHPREDIAFARLARHCPDLERVLSRLHQEHRVITTAGRELLSLVEAAQVGDVVPRARIEAAAATYLVYYENHIATEENEVLSRAARELTADDWEAVRAGVPALPDPVFGRDPQDRYKLLRRRIAQEA